MISWLVNSVMEFPQLIAIFLVFFLIASLVYVFYYIPALSLPSTKDLKKSASIELKQIVCNNGVNVTCPLGSCDGIRTCKNGQWSECYLIKICFPGANTSCNENGCAVGHKTCNECGTGYGECTEE